jgi:hypothetical protein
MKHPLPRGKLSDSSDRGILMHEPTGSSLGNALGSFAVMIGILYFGWGLFNALRGEMLDGVDGLVFGGLALVAGCVILLRRGGAKSKLSESSPAEQSSPDGDRISPP